MTFQRTIFAALLVLLGTPALAQTSIPTRNFSVTITTGLTYQVVAPAVNPVGAPNPNAVRNTLEIQNNNAADACWVNYDGLVVAGNTTATSVTTQNQATTAQQASVSLAAGQSLTRYYPHTPNAAIVATCATTGDSLYVALQ